MGTVRRLMRSGFLGPGDPASRLHGSLRLLPVCLLLACASSTADIGGPLSIELTVDRTSGVAGLDAFLFNYQATGENLLGVVLDFGDAQADSLAAQGSTSAGATRSHIYDAPGTYSAVARVMESFGTAVADTVVVEVLASLDR